MTDKQFDGVIKMIRGAVAKCKDLREAIEYLDDLLEDGGRKEKKKED